MKIGSKTWSALAIIAILTLVGCASYFNSSNWPLTPVPNDVRNTLAESNPDVFVGEHVGLNDAVMVRDIYANEKQRQAEKLVQDAQATLTRFDADITWVSNIRAAIKAFSVETLNTFAPALAGTPLGPLGLVVAGALGGLGITLPGTKKKFREEGKAEVVRKAQGKGVDLPADVIVE